MDVKLVVVGGKQAGTEIPVPGPTFLIGRGETCQIRPQSKLVSRKHCMISIAEGSVAIEDCGSTNGTFVNGQKLEQQRLLHNRDLIKIGMLEFKVHLGVPGKEKGPEAHDVPAAATKGEDLDISSWLEEDGVQSGAALTSEKSGVLQDTSTGTTMAETVNMPTDPGRQPEEKKPAKKIVGQFQRATKPKAESSRSAAEDMLRQFFPTKKP